LVVITVDDADPDAELAGAAADGEVVLLVLPLLLALLLHAAAASSATASGAASLIGTGTRASNEALIVIIPLARRWAVCRRRSVRLCCANYVRPETAPRLGLCCVTYVTFDAFCARRGNFSVVSR
jgi:hypothetical protein